MTDLNSTWIGLGSTWLEAKDATWISANSSEWVSATWVGQDQNSEFSENDDLLITRLAA